MTDRYEKIRRALEMGPTPGEWYWSDAYPTQDGRKTWSLIGDGGFGILSCDGDENSPQSVDAAAAELIAACDPDTIRELLAERDALAAAMSQAPAAGEEIMVNAAHDVYTLPLQPSGLSSGPRFVVHVPGPEQPAPPDSGEVVEAVGYENEDGTLFGYANHKAYERNPGAIPVRIMRATDYDRMQSALAAAQQRYADGLEAWKANNAHFAARIAELREAGQAVVDRWDTPLWKDVPATAEYINRLRALLSAVERDFKEGA